MNIKFLMLFIGIVIFAVFGVYFYLTNKSAQYFSNNNQMGIREGFSKTRFEIEEDAIIPEPEDKTVPEGVAKPVTVAPAAPEVSAKLRAFVIKADKNEYNPATVIVNKGDTVRISFTAVDKTYDITIPDYGLKQTAAQGETKILEFQALNEGGYVFYCESCGGADSEVKGEIIINNR